MFIIHQSMIKRFYRIFLLEDDQVMTVFFDLHTV